MAYIGQQGGVTATITSKTLDTMTGDGSDTTLTLSQTPTSAEDVSIYADGVYQRPTNEYTVSGDVVTFTTAPASGVFVCAVTGGGHHIGSPMAGSVSTSKIIDGTITNAMVATMSSSKLTGALGALDGSALTGIPSSITKNASDPAINTNPSGGLGTVWANTTDGEMFVCTDATTNENVWYNVGEGTGDVKPFAPQGTLQGFCSGGYAGGARINVIEKYSFTANGNSSDHGDLTAARDALTGTQSKTHGYCSGGENPKVNVLDKFAFSANANATTVGTITVARSKGAGNSSETHGYTSGGENGGNSNVIDKHSFSTDGNATDVGDLTVARAYTSGSGTADYGYSNGGTTGTVTNVIDRFPYASDANATDVADLLEAINGTAGTSSTTHGYASGGYTTGYDNRIQKYTFASNNNSTDVGDISITRNYMAGTSSTTHGHSHAGWTGSYFNVIDKHSFSTDGNATDVGDLTAGKFNASGQSF